MRRLSTALALALLFAGAAVAQAPSPERYAGRYRFDGSDEDGRRRVQRALAPTLRRLHSVLRALAERRLNDSVPVARRIDIGLDGEEIAIRYVGEDDRTFRSRAGRPRAIEGLDGREARMTQLFRDGHLEQVFEGERGRMYNVFELSRDGRRLTLTVVMTGERLEEPIRITLPYVRVGD
ncbi:MAG TPA: hypothetical protein RMH99_02160 [Sandaracinaceae bacterium LLY-WYZ-13_1]|nr:hypothetical protein [Sandaracinaceae bacterium LLY-WYZ-13_1]